MKCLIRSRVIFCTVQDVTRVRMQGKEEEGEEYRGNNIFDRDSEILNKKKEKENSGVRKYSLQMQPWNNISSTAHTSICPSKLAA